VSRTSRASTAGYSSKPAASTAGAPNRSVRRSAAPRGPVA
jgi:hypothetical protein